MRCTPLRRVVIGEQRAADSDALPVFEIDREPDAHSEHAKSYSIIGLRDKNTGTTRLGYLFPSLEHSSCPHAPRPPTTFVLANRSATVRRLSERAKTFVRLQAKPVERAKAFTCLPAAVSRRMGSLRPFYPEPERSGRPSTSPFSLVHRRATSVDLKHQLDLRSPLVLVLVLGLPEYGGYCNDATRAHTCGSAPSPSPPSRSSSAPSPSPSRSSSTPKAPPPLLLPEAGRANR
ncbi:hypothetical protein C8R47DRAFT_1229710 [Mycena vitilis]|nr:hypothetical protein C8R47DRAFT_1229710 [Mycena vitilis]